MVKPSRPAVKMLTLIKSRDIVVDKLLKPCEEERHSKCTGWAVLKREISPIDANYFLRCTCACHHHKKGTKKIKHMNIRKKILKKKIKKAKAKKRKAKPIRKSKKSRTSRRARRR